MEGSIGAQRADKEMYRKDEDLQPLTRRQGFFLFLRALQHVFCSTASGIPALRQTTDLPCTRRVGSIGIGSSHIEKRTSLRGGETTCRTRRCPRLAGRCTVRRAKREGCRCGPSAVHCWVASIVSSSAAAEHKRCRATRRRTKAAHTGGTRSRAWRAKGERTTCSTGCGCIVRIATAEGKRWRRRVRLVRSATCSTERKAC